MMVGATKVRIDENEADKLTKVKKFGVTAKETTKRAALGDLQNRGVLRNAGGKDATNKELNDGKLKATIGNVKKVAGISAVAKTNSSNGSAHVVLGKAAVGAATRKPLTRSSSLRVPLANSNTVGTTASTVLQRNGNANILHDHNKPKTLTTKIVENKVQHVKVVSKSKTSTEDKSSKVVSSKAAAATLRREDSSLSRQSLSKLKAALSRDSSKGSVKTSTNITTSTTTTTNSIKPLPATKKPTANDESDFNVLKIVAKPAQFNLKIVSVQTHSSQLLDAVEDIDAEDGDKLLLVSEYVNDIYNYLFQLEVEQPIRPDHLAAQLEVYPKMRAVLIDWINEVHFQFHLAPETFQMAVAIIDQYLQFVQDTKRSHLQLVGVTALFIAAKYEELYPPAIADFVYITDDTYSAKQILQMELRMFKTLDYNLSRPLPIHFLRRFSKAGKAEDVHHAMSKYFLELTSVEYELASYKPSEIAAASLFLTLHLLTDDAKKPTGFNNKHWTPTLEWYSRYTATHLRPITRKIAAVVRNAVSAKLRAVYTKYQSSKFHKISTRSELYGALIDSIINSKN